VRQVVPSNHQQAAGPKAFERSAERLFDLGGRIDAPADDAIAEYEVENLEAEMAPYVLHPVDEVPVRSVAPLERIDVEGPKVPVLEQLRVGRGVPTAADPKDVMELRVRHDVGKDVTFEDLPVGEAPHQGRTPGRQDAAEEPVVEIAHDLGP